MFSKLSSLLHSRANSKRQRNSESPATEQPAQEPLFFAVQKNPTERTTPEPVDIAQLILSILTTACNQLASDVHIEPSKNKLCLRFRVDGRLIVQELLDPSLLPNLVSYLKITSNLDIAESRLPKDSSFRLEALPETDFRLSILPTIFGEKIAIRLIHRTDLGLSLAESGIFAPDDLPAIEQLLARQHGCILVTGPTGSGKSTTLSRFLAHLNQAHVNITTIEDPVEHVLPRVNHVNLNTKIGLDFNTLLRHILRQDPDIIMIGEIRDEETAATVVRAAITGHLVLSTLHTNDALSTINRLLDMGVPRYLLTDALSGIISQRLVRRLCPHCKQSAPLPAWLGEKYALTGDMYRPAGCEHCHNTGYSGRLAIYEILTVTASVRAHMTQGELSALADYYQPLSHHALSQLTAGHTSLEEIVTFV